MLRAAAARVVAKVVVCDPMKRIAEKEVETMGIERNAKGRTEGSAGGDIFPCQCHSEGEEASVIEDQQL